MPNCFFNNSYIINIRLTSHLYDVSRVEALPGGIHGTLVLTLAVGRKQPFALTCNNKSKWLSECDLTLNTGAGFDLKISTNKERTDLCWLYRDVLHALLYMHMYRCAFIHMYVQWRWRWAGSHRFFLQETTKVHSSGTVIENHCILHTSSCKTNVWP